MRYVTTLVFTGALLPMAAADASAQRWGRSPVPSIGACFYEDSNYNGQYFCSRVGSVMAQVPPGTNDRISSIRVFGHAEVVVFRDSNFRGSSRRFSANMSNLKRAGWNDRISSFRVAPRLSSDGNWGGAYGGGSWSGGYGGGAHGDNWGGAYGAGSHGSRGRSSGGRWTYAQAESMVRQAYRSVFNREPDPASRPWITEVMKNNWSQSQLEARLRNTPEYRERHRRR